ncbi:MAG: 23S rRNA (guanosine(2251)-2'-O)-methyltransferase RlmB [Beijerinckiaceae bacterium]|nr:23S rRNA (guanosine(2251)-2'-O)-methyltransferase RlmB [Beijerinckiaceae bacterium]
MKSPRRKFREQRDGRGRSSEQSAGDDGLHLLYGIHSVREALRNPRRSLKRLLATENGALRLQEDGPLPLTPTIVKPDEIGRRLSADAVHQGVLLEAEPLAPISLTDIPKSTIVLALDQVTDPHNVGAILRSCAAFNVGALLITERHSPEVTGVLAKAASGALEHVPFAVVRNLSDALEKLKGRGFACIGLDSEAERPIGDVAMERPLVLVMGAEGKGLRQKTRETCTVLARLDMPGAIKSLNVSNAAAIALYAVTTALSK